MRRGLTLVTRPMWQKSPSSSRNLAGVSGFHLKTAMPGLRSAAERMRPFSDKCLRQMVLLPW